MPCGASKTLSLRLKAEITVGVASMPDQSRIDRGLYWSKSWRVVSGCEKVSTGCAHCWSERETVMRGKDPNKKIAERYGGGECTTGGKWNGTIRLATERVLTEPLRVIKPQVWAAWNDLFHKDVSVADIIRVFEIMWQCPQHVFIILTKRYERMKAVMSGAIANAMGPGAEPATHIWLGATAENTEMGTITIPIHF